MNAAFAASAELLFVVLPFIVIAITLGHKGEFRTVFRIPEWSIVSCVILGQSIVKLVALSLSLGRKAILERVLALVSFLLVCLLIPNLLVLVLVLTAGEASRVLAISQMILFVIAVTIFWMIMADTAFTLGSRENLETVNPDNEKIP